MPSKPSSTRFDNLELWLDTSAFKWQIIVLPQTQFKPGEFVRLVCKETGEEVESEVVMATLRFKERAFFSRVVRHFGGKRGDKLCFEDVSGRKKQRVLRVTLKPMPEGYMEEVKTSMRKTGIRPAVVANIKNMNRVIHESKRRESGKMVPSNSRKSGRH